MEAETDVDSKKLIWATIADQINGDFQQTVKEEYDVKIPVEIINSHGGAIKDGIKMEEGADMDSKELNLATNADLINGGFQGTSNHYEVDIKEEYDVKVPVEIINSHDGAVKTEEGADMDFKESHSSIIKATYKCNESNNCNFEFMSKSALYDHIRRLHTRRIKAFKCTECSYETWKKNDMMKHYACRHNKSKKVYKCGKCAYETKVRQYLQRHRKVHDKNIKLLRCSQCSFETKWTGHFKEHFLKKHDNEAETCKCEHCSYETKSKTLLINHLRNIHGRGVENVRGVRVKPYHCELCPFKTTTTNSIKAHMQKIHDEDGLLHNCSHCPYVTRNRSTFYSHVRSKHGQTEFKCTDCECTFGSPYRLKAHFNNVHLGREEGYECSMCGFTAKHKISLHRHVAVAHHKNTKVLSYILCP